MRGDADSRSALTAFIVMVLLVGGNAVAVKLSVLELDPFWSAGSRFIIASMFFFGAMMVRGLPWPSGRALWGDLAYGLFTYALPFSLFYWGMQEAPVGAGIIIFASVPLLTMLAASLHGLERLSMRGLLGSAFAIMGFVLVFRDQLDLNVPLGSMLVLLGSSVCFAESIVIVKLFPSSHPVSKNAIGMSFGALLLLLLSLAVGESFAMPLQLDTRLAMLYLITLGSVGVFSLYLFVLKSWTASAASYSAVASPFVSVALGAILLGERLTPIFGVGAGLVLVGVYIGALHPKGRATTPAPATTASPPSSAPASTRTAPSAVAVPSPECAAAAEP